MTTTPRLRELSGITPSGSLTLGNYLGALRRFVDRQHQVDGFYFVADLHALTTTHDPNRHRNLTRSTAATFIAAGLDPAASTTFIQSHVPTHIALAYLLECTAHIGELSRMIQFKEKGALPGARASLFTYPCLMAADILLYQARTVPVGGDQSQHVELTRDLAQRFNTLYGDTFIVPELIPAALAARVADLQDPVIKMNKSAPDDTAGVIRILDSPDVIARKIRRAVTDSDNQGRYDAETKPGISNLLDILSVLTGTNPADEAEHHPTYEALKNAVADAVIAALEPIHARYDELIDDPNRLDTILGEGAQRAHQASQPVLDRAAKAMGVV